MPLAKEHNSPAVFRLSEFTWLLEPAGVFSIETNRRIHETAKWLRTNHGGIFCQVVPAYHALMVELHQAVNRLNAALIKPGAMETLLKAAWNACLQNEQQAPHLLEIPVCYHPALNNDLEAVSLVLGLPIENIVRLHCSHNYHVFMLGFLPGFTYMGILPVALQIPRKSQPAPVRAGAVAIAGQQTGIYPIDSPGGWHVLGYTPWKIFDADNELRPALPEPGNLVRFLPIDLQSFKSMKQWPSK